MKLGPLPIWIGKGATMYEWQIGPYYGGFVHLRGGLWSKWRSFFQRFHFGKDTEWNQPL